RLLALGFVAGFGASHDRGLVIEDNRRAEILADLAKRLAAVVGGEQQSAGFVLEREDETPVGIGPIHGDPIDVRGLFAEGRPRRARLVAYNYRGAVDQRDHKCPERSAWIRQDAARRFGAPLRGLAERLPGLAAIGRAVHALVTEPDEHVAG